MNGNVAADIMSLLFMLRQHAQRDHLEHADVVASGESVPDALLAGIVRRCCGVCLALVDYHTRRAPRRLRWCTQRSREIVGLARHCGAGYDPAVLKPTPLPRGAEVRDY